jgi:hypothetical protein
LTDQEQNDESRPFHQEGSAVVFEKPKSQEETARQRREDEQHEFARSQVKTNHRLAVFTGLLVLGTFCGTLIGIWQAIISQTAAGAAKDAAITAKEAVHLSERAYITIGISEFDLKTRTVTLSVTNSGRISSGSVDIVIHSFIMNTDPSQPTIYLKDAIEKGWKQSRYSSAPIGTRFQISHVFKTIDEAVFSKGKQHVIVVGVATYNDGFPDTPLQRSPFCMDAIFNTVMNKTQMTPCDPSVYLPAAEIADGYPSNEDR